MNPKSAREQTIRDAKSCLILDAARTVFAEKGFHEARLEDIAAAAGFSKASLYNYFTDKEQIFLSLAIRDFENLLSQLQKVLANAATVYESIEFIFRTVLHFFQEHFAFFWAVTNFESNFNFGMHRFTEQHEEMKSRFEEYYATLLQSFASILTTAKERKEISSAIDEAALARFIATLVCGTVFEWKLSGKTGDIEKRVADLMDFTMFGLGAVNKS